MAKGSNAGKKSGKSTKKGAGGGRKKRRVETFSSYIYKVLKQVHPDTGISKKAMRLVKGVVSGATQYSLQPSLALFLPPTSRPRCLYSIMNR